MNLVDLLPIVIIMCMFGVPWFVVYKQSQRLAAVEVELREISTLIKNDRGISDRGVSDA